MKRKLLSLLFVVFATTYFCSAQVLFDPADYSAGDSVAPGISIVDIGGTNYLQVIPEGYSTYLPLPEFKLGKGQSATSEVKYAMCAATDDTLNLANLQIVVQLQDTVNLIKNPWGDNMIPSFTQLTKNPAIDTFAAVSASIGVAMKFVHQLQFYGQVASGSYPATTGDTMWVGIISIDPPLADSVVVTATADTIDTELGTVQMSAVVYPAERSQVVSWSVDGMNASIDEDGLLTAYSNGDVVVTATSVDGTEGTYKIILQGQVPSAMPIAKNIVGSFDGPSDYTGTVAIGWEADTVYMEFFVVDDSIVPGTLTATNNYQVDNIEIYFDLDNSKNVHYPRNGNWVSSPDPVYDDNDNQFRLVLGVDSVLFDPNNGQFPAKVEYTRTDTGYIYNVRIAWDDIMSGFTPVAGDTIGFDVLLSDNDAVASDANRNQFTWVSPTDKAFNDPSLWGTLAIVEGGLFAQLPEDNIAPSKPTLSGTAGILSDTLRWTASNDNLAILYYEINVGSDKIIYYPTALNANYSYIHKNLEVMEYTYTIVAYDNFGNKSATSNTLALTPLERVNIDVINANNFAVYPNPVVNELNIKNASSIVKVEVLGINGNVVTTSVYSNEQLITINTSQLSSGLYFVRMTTAEGQVVMNKIIKK